MSVSDLVAFGLMSVGIWLFCRAVGKTLKSENSSASKNFFHVIIILYIIGYKQLTIKHRPYLNVAMTAKSNCLLGYEKHIGLIFFYNFMLNHMHRPTYSRYNGSETRLSILNL